MRKLQVILLGSGVFFLAYLLIKVGLRDLWQQLSVLGWGLIPLALGEGIAEMIHTVGWRYCLSGPIRSLSWWNLYRIRMAGYAINYLTPTAALGGEVTKGALLSSRHPGPDAASGVLIGKLCFAVAHLVFVTLGGLLVLWRVKLPHPLWQSMFASGALIAVCMATFFSLQKHGKLGGLVRWLAARKVASTALHKAANNLSCVDETMKLFYQERPWGVPVAIGCHLLGYSIGIAQTWLFFHLLHQPATWTVAASIWFLGMWFDLLTFAVPQNLGTLEGTRALLMQTFGYSALTGVTYGFFLRLAQIVWSCAGLLMYASLLHSRGTNGVSHPTGLPQTTGAHPAPKPSLPVRSLD